MHTAKLKSFEVHMLLTVLPFLVSNVAIVSQVHLHVKASSTGLQVLEHIFPSNVPCLSRLVVSG